MMQTQRPDNEIFSDADLRILFDTFEKRELFVKGMTKLINIITERTVNVPFVCLDRIE